MSFFSRKNMKTNEATAVSAPPAAEPTPVTSATQAAAPAAEPAEEFSPALPLDAAETAPAPSAESELSPEFYGSYSGAVETTPAPAEEPSPAASEPETSGIDFSVLDIEIPESLAAAPETAEPTVPDFAMPSSDNAPMAMPMPGDDDDLVLPDLPPLPDASSYETKKSMGYETTVKLANARSAYGNEKPVNEPIKTDAPRNNVPKSRDFTVVASGTAHVSGDLPKLKDGEMYVALTPKELRRLKSRRFRGLGVLATLALVVIAAFCVWSYAQSFVDPLIGVWKGDVDSACIPIGQVQELDQKSFDSTWEFSSSGSMYLNMVVNETPISLSGSYEQKKDKDGEPYLSMTLTNPMDSSDYTMEMYYTVTGDVLEFNDMEGMNITIDLKKKD